MKKNDDLPKKKLWPKKRPLRAEEVAYFQKAALSDILTGRLFAKKKILPPPA